MGFKLKPKQIGVTPRALLGNRTFNELERILRRHLDDIGDPPKEGEFPCLVFGQMKDGSVCKIKFPGEFQ